MLAEAEALRLKIGVGNLADIIGLTSLRREAQHAFTLIVGNRLRVGSVKERAAVEEAFLDLLGQVEVRCNVQRLGLAVAAVYKRELAALVDYDGRERHAVLLAVKLLPGERPGEVGRAEAAAELDRAVFKVCHILFVGGTGERLVLAVGVAGVEKALYVRSTVRREAGRILYDRVGCGRFHIQKIVHQDEIKGNDGTGRAVAKALFRLGCGQGRMYAVHAAEIGDRAVAVLAALIADAAVGVVDAEVVAGGYVFAVRAAELIAPSEILVAGYGASCTEVHGQLPRVTAPTVGRGIAFGIPRTRAAVRKAVRGLSVAQTCVKL